MPFLVLYASLHRQKQQERNLADGLTIICLQQQILSSGQLRLGFSLAQIALVLLEAHWTAFPCTKSLSLSECKPSCWTNPTVLQPC